MALPRQKHSKGRTARKRSHHALKAVSLSVCPKCKHPIRPHYACSNCGYYRGREVVHIHSALDKKARRKLQRQEANQQKAEAKAEAKAEKQAA